MRKHLKSGFSLSLALIMSLVLFQNCSGGGSLTPVKFISVTSAQSGGNGDFYGGKPEPGSYYRFVANGPCGLDGKEPLGRIDVGPDTLFAELTRPADCTKSVLPLRPEQLEFSRYNPRLLGFGEGAYVRYHKRPQEADAIAVEAWCRRPDSGASAGFDVLVEANGTTGEILATIYKGATDTSGATVASRSAPVAVGKTRLGNRLEYAAPEFRLEIGAPDPGADRAPARLLTRSPEGPIDEKLVCRRAGSEDPADVTVPLLAWNLPGKVEVEDYDAGGEGIGYHDTTPGDAGAGNPRAGDDVDVVVFTLTSGSGVSDTAAGEWLKYAVNATVAGEYELTIGIDSTMATGPSALHIEVDGVDVTGRVDVPVGTNTPGRYPVYTFPRFRMTQGAHSLRIVIDQGTFNMNHMTFAQTAP